MSRKGQEYLIEEGVSMDIRCRKTSCVYNDRYTCKAKGIEITKSSLCKKFEKGEGVAVDKTKNMFSRTPEYAPQRNSKTISISCQAHCLFNKNGSCQANGITLNDFKNKPLCVTFLRK